MQTAASLASLASLAQWVVRITGITQVVLGLLFWTNRAFRLVPLHMAIGLAFVIAIWVLAAVAARAGVAPWLALLGGAWGILVLALGITQGRLLPGPMHWIVKVLHLLVGFAAMVLAARLGAQIRKRRGGERSTEFQAHGGMRFRVGQ
ncbi:MAG TPA: hypothetical protein VKA84_10375 [Gemmatimonadaceae bacterium]|nr:hypothetical protein [Gemmatimonadaceae bacterium]